MTNAPFRGVVVSMVFLAIAAGTTCDFQDSPTAPSTPRAVAPANVVIIEGPLFVDGYTIFYIKGRVQNQGKTRASFAKVTFYVRTSASVLLAQETSYIDDYDLDPDETAPFEVLFSDSGRAIRNAMDFSKTTWEIKWD